MRPPLVIRKFTPLAQSRLLPPPSPTKRSTRSRRAISRARSTSSVVGLGVTSSKSATSRPAARSEPMARSSWPARLSPLSVTTKTRRPPSSAASSPRRLTDPGPKTTRVFASYSNGLSRSNAVPRVASNSGVPGARIASTTCCPPRGIDSFEGATCLPRRSRRGSIGWRCTRHCWPRRARYRPRCPR